MLLYAIWLDFPTHAHIKDTYIIVILQYKDMCSCLYDRFALLDK